MKNRLVINRAVQIYCVLVLMASSAVAQSNGPQPTPLPAAIAAPQDTPYPGVIRLQVDATDIDRHIFQVRETIPVRGGEPLVLLYPEWLPAFHADYGRVENLTGLKIYANGERLEWLRDPVNVYALHVDVPADATTLELEFQFASAVDKSHGSIVVTREMLNFKWLRAVLYPAGHFARQITVEASIRVRDGWQLATALETASSRDDVTVFKPVTLENLVDSPIFAGRYFKRLDLNPGGTAPVHLNVIADREDLLAVTPEQLDAHRELVTQANKLFDSHHYDHYDFLFALSDRMSGEGLEHHQSSENALFSTYFTAWDERAKGRDLLAHEYVHSWNGKFRQPANLWAANLNEPMRGSLLWLYEGQTQYWGYMLSARSGILSAQQTLDALAMTAAYYDKQAGREWRSLRDTTNDPVAALRRSQPWESWTRNEDYYSEGQLIWLDADTLIRDLSNGRKSLDDFASAFFGINDGSYVALTYTFEDVVATLNSVQPYDWETFLQTRLDSHGPEAPLDGIRRGGYELVYTDTPSEYFVDSEINGEKTDLRYSIGISIADDGNITEVFWGSPAFKEGLTIGNYVVAVNGIAYDADGLKRAISDAHQVGTSVDLLIKDGVHYRTVSMDYHDGLRYPSLQRSGDGPAYLDQILAPRK